MSRAFFRLSCFTEFLFRFGLSRWLILIHFLKRQSRRRANVDTGRALQAVPLTQKSLFFKIHDLVPHRAVFFAPAAAEASVGDGQLIFVPAGSVTDAANRTDGTPGTGAIRHAKDHSRNRCDQAHLPENQPPVIKAARVLRQTVGHETHQADHDDGAEFHAEQFFRDWPHRCELGEESIEEATSWTEITANIAPADDATEHAAQHGDWNNEAEKWILPAKSQHDQHSSCQEPTVSRCCRQRIVI